MKPLPNTLTIKGDTFLIVITTDAPMSLCNQLSDALNAVMVHPTRLRFLTDDDVSLYNNTVTKE
jgi:hypothetical protein